MIDQGTLKSLVHYDPDTGVFTNIKNRGGLLAGTVLEGKESSGYIVFRIKKQTYKAHRLAFLYMTGSIPEYVDHKNNVRHDNRWRNLREATWTQNQHNSSIRSDNTSGFKGVRWHKKYSKWQADIKCDKQTFYLGMYDSIEEAATVVAAKRAELHKDYARY